MRYVLAPELKFPSPRESSAGPRFLIPQMASRQTHG
jgi:hypothetical protein